ncbi:transcription factor IIIA isoform X1 [Medicago truncatula]|uniref:transcription factor IIIA isoform X1 n=2 Tax=Medicago truncatula TaxID=3880 RepID=UPI0019680E32|nr:transcription factor IIIA-like isoform X1 [Medicago truncatula]
MEESIQSDEIPKFRDIRRYYCQFCGICRSKKNLITSHINSEHKEEMEKARVETEPESLEGGLKANTCEECGASFKKHAYLLQHMQSHSLERPFVCSLENCKASYRRKDHLNRHLLQHQGKTFKCPIENCKSGFSLQSNLKRHVEEMHDENSTPPCSGENQKQFVCPEIGCGKVFRYASQLQKHEDSHVRLETIEVVCLEPGCMKFFTNSECLKAHVKSCHQYVTCDTCGTKQLKKNMKRHLRTHEASNSSEAFKCEFEGCDSTFSTKSNLHKHEKAVHFQVKPFVCGFPNCGMRFAYKHVRDNHEKTAKHAFALGDFEEADEEFRSRPRGGAKRKCPPTVEMLVRKRVAPPSQLENLLFVQDCQ